MSVADSCLWSILTSTWSCAFGFGAASGAAKAPGLACSGSSTLSDIVSKEVEWH